MWSLLVLLLVSQVSFAAHQFEHSADELHETCTYCLHFARDDELPVSAEATPLPSMQFTAVAVETPVAFGAQVFCHYRSRASP